MDTKSPLDKVKAEGMLQEHSQCSLSCGTKLELILTGPILVWMREPRHYLIHSEVHFYCTALLANADMV